MLSLIMVFLIKLTLIVILFLIYVGKIWHVAAVVDTSYSAIKKNLNLFSTFYLIDKKNEME